MIAAHTVRRLKPGTFEQFAETFGPPEGAESSGWVRFYMLRAIADEDEVITFGFFDGTVEQLDASQDELGYSETRGAIEPLVDAVIANGLYEIVKSRAAAGDAAV
jgi:hypothetical protein